MHTEFGLLETASEREAAERIRLALSASPDAFFADCRERCDAATRTVETALREIGNAVDQCERERLCWLGELVAFADGLPIPRSVFRSALSERDMGELCRRLARLDRCARKAGAVGLAFSSVQHLLSTAQTQLSEVSGFLLRAACATEGENARCLRELCAPLDREEQLLRKRVEEWRLIRNAWIGFCTEEILRFLHEVRRRADLAGEGRECDLSSLHRLTGEMRQRTEAVLKSALEKGRDL